MASLSIFSFILRLICQNGLISKSEVSASYRHVSTKVLTEFPQMLDISGDPEPSREDKNLTMKMGIALLSMEVTLQDHIIVGDSYYSMADSGYIESIHERINNLIAG